MLLTVDIGNSHITLGVYDGELMRCVARVVTDPRLTEDQYAIEFGEVLDLYRVDRKEITGAAISSVVPELTVTISEAIRKSIGVQVVIVGPGVKTGLNIRIDNPAQLGADLVAGAVAAVAQFPMPCLVFDMGTATSITVLDKNGCLLGVSICAGVGIMLEALFSRTALLPHVNIEMPASPIGKNTVHSMQSGLIYGTAAMMDGMAERMEEILGSPATLVATGGLAKKILPACKRKFIHCDHLLLDGLRLIYEKNIKQQ